jgi:hypothetical protein
MPRVKKENLPEWREFNALRRNLKMMTPEDMEHYVKTGEIKPSKGKYKHGRGMVY